FSKSFETSSNDGKSGFFSSFLSPFSTRSSGFSCDQTGTANRDRISQLGFMRMTDSTGSGASTADSFLQGRRFSTRCRKPSIGGTHPEHRRRFPIRGIRHLRALESSRIAEPALRRWPSVRASPWLPSSPVASLSRGRKQRSRKQLEAPYALNAHSYGGPHP